MDATWTLELCLIDEDGNYKVDVFSNIVDADGVDHKEILGDISGGPEDLRELAALITEALEAGCTISK